MATSYVGHRPVLKGRNFNDAVNPYKGKAGTYSYWNLYNTSHVLDGAPDNNHVPGEGRHPHAIELSRMFLGLWNAAAFPLVAPGLGPRLAYFRTKPLEWKGVTSSNAVGNPGHAPRPGAFTYSRWNTRNFFLGVPSANPLLNGGHAERGINGIGAASSFGRFGPNAFHGLTVDAALFGGGKAKPAATDTTAYGHKHVDEWFGVTSAKAL